MGVRIFTCLIIAFGFCTTFGQQSKDHAVPKQQITVNVPQQPIKVVEVDRAPPVQPVVNVQKESSLLPLIAIIISVASAAASWFGIYRARVLAREKARAKLYPKLLLHSAVGPNQNIVLLKLHNVGELPATKIVVNASIPKVSLQGEEL